jgi:hypothetical protein
VTNSTACKERSSWGLHYPKWRGVATGGKKEKRNLTKRTDLEKYPRWRVKVEKKIRTQVGKCGHVVSYPHTHSCGLCTCMRPHPKKKKKKSPTGLRVQLFVGRLKFIFFPSKERRRNTRPFFTRPQGNTIGGYVKELPTTPTTIKTQNSKNKSRNISELQK